MKKHVLLTSVIYFFIGCILFFPILGMLGGILSPPDPTYQIVAILVIVIYFGSYVMLTVKNSELAISLLLIILILSLLIYFYESHKIWHTPHLG
jgi:hypothetical protein